jgi:hypothetical protein
MIGRRDKSWRRIGAALAGAALYAQLAFASWGMLALAAPGSQSDAFGGHALCLAAQDGAAPTTPPADAPAAPIHDHGAFCCLWHPLPGLQPFAAATPVPVAYADIARGHFGEAPFIAEPRRGPANARAPPNLT